MNLNLKSLALVNLGTNFSLRYVSNSLRINSKIWVKTQNEWYLCHKRRTVQNL